MAGGSAQGVGSPGNGVVAVRYNSDGTLDTTFGTAGKFTASGTLSTLNAPRGWALQPDGKIVIGGSASGDWAVGRLTAAGAIDATFGTGGITFTNLGGADDRAWVLRVQPDGMIVGAGTGAGIFALARYTSGGVLDAGFGTGGIVTTGFPGTSGARALRVLADGKVLAAGFSGPVFTPDFALARYTTAGVADATFGAGGQVTTNFGCNDTAFDLVQQPYAMVVAVGYGFAACGGPNQAIALARYLTFTCGNATIEAGEQCDDGNTASGDCCDASCQAETGNACTDDGNACTDDQCNGSGVCAHPSNSAPCDDGVFCNGADTCSGGACAQHAGDPCAGGTECADACNEAADDCFDPGGTPAPTTATSAPTTRATAAGACAHPPTRCRATTDSSATAPTRAVVAPAATPAIRARPARSAQRLQRGGRQLLRPAGAPCTSDGNVCTTDQCNGGGACVHPTNTAPCNDGVFCNGADTCSGGVCPSTPAIPARPAPSARTRATRAPTTATTPAAWRARATAIRALSTPAPAPGRAPTPPATTARRATTRTPAADGRDVQRRRVHRRYHRRLRAVRDLRQRRRVHRRHPARVARARPSPRRPSSSSRIARPTTSTR